MKCKICGSDKIIKNGKVKGQQQYLCRNCRHQFISEFGRHTDWEERMAVALYAVGLSFRTIAALFCVDGATIYRWVRNFAQLKYTKPTPQGEVVIELDEMHHFIRSKKTNAGYGKHIAEQLDSFLTGSAGTEQVKRLKNY